MDIFDKCNTDQGYFGPFRLKDDHYYTRPVLDPVPERSTHFQGKECVQWSLNNYLGLAQSQELRVAAEEAVRAYGPSAPMGSRMLTGNTRRHIELEGALADYLEKDSSIVFNYGYLGVLGTLSSLVQKNDAIVIDKMSHACMVDGTLMSQGAYRVFKHNDMDSLEKHLKFINKTRKGGILIVVEGVYGMSGDIASLKEICALKEKYDARLFVDDAHGFGVIGPQGKGAAAHWGVQDSVDIYFGTFAKAFAAIGGVSASTKPVIEWIRYNARTQVFAKSLPMIYVEVVSKALDIIRNDTERRSRMWRIASALRSGLKDAGFEVGDGPSPITPVYVRGGDIETGMGIMRSLREKGIFVNGVTYPVVPKGVFLFRMIPTAAHTGEDVRKTVDAFTAVRDELKLNG